MAQIWKMALFVLLKSLFGREESVVGEQLLIFILVCKERKVKASL